MAHNFQFKMKPSQSYQILIHFLILLSLKTLFATEAPLYDCEEPKCVLLDRCRASQMKIIVDGSNSSHKKLRIFCHPGQERTWSQLWVNPRISIEGKNSVAPSDMSIYYGQNVSDVESQLSGLFPSFSLHAWLLLKEEHSFSPFNLSCIGLASTHHYSVLFRVKNPELWYIAYIAIGIVIFFFAPSWSRNIAFHYTTGMTVGVLASVLIVMFLLTRLLPQRLKTLSYVVMGISSSCSLFMFQLVKTYLQDIVQNHWQIALAYVLVAAVVSFALIYRFGPITDGRTLNLVCWTMQACGLVFIYQGTQIPEASAAIILLVLTVYLVPKATPRWLTRLRFRVFPPRRRFLTEEEFLVQGQEETRKALKELREYCRSPQCDAWKVLSQLESPSRFAKFVAGDSHLSDEEYEDHEEFINSNRSHLRNANFSANTGDDDDDSDSDNQFVFRPQPSNHVNDGYLDSDSEIEEPVHSSASSRYRR